jgi:hypothetical protein
VGEVDSRSGRPPALSALGLGSLLIALEGLVFAIVGLINIASLFSGSILGVNAFGAILEGSWVAALVPVTLASVLGGFWTLFGGGRLLVAASSIGWLVALALIAVGTGQAASLALAIPAVLVLGGVWSESRARGRGAPRVRGLASPQLTTRRLAGGAALIAVTVWLLWVVVVPGALGPIVQDIRQSIDSVVNATFEPRASP